MSTTPGISPYEPCSSWNLSQTVTVTPVVDGITEGSHIGVIEFANITSNDTNYSGLALPSSLTVPIVDDTDVDAPVIEKVRISGPGGSDPNYTALSGAEDVTLTFISNEYIDLSTSTITVGGVSVTCTQPSTIGDAYICVIPASSLTIGNVYGPLGTIEVTAHDASGNIATTITATEDSSQVTITSIVCGNNVQETGEQCDDGNTTA